MFIKLIFPFYPDLYRTCSSYVVVLFFMAINGVTPRAKMNQWWSWRFRIVKEVKEVQGKVLAKGEKLLDEKAFDGVNKTSKIIRSS